MHKLKIIALYPEAGWGLPKVKSYASYVCTRAESVFRANMDVMETLGMVPGYAFMNGEDWGISVIQAMNTVKAANPGRDVLPLDDDVQKLASSIWDDYDRGGFDKSRRDHFREATENAEKMACYPGRNLSHGALHSLLKSMISGTWTAFEVLASSLVRESIAKHPRCFPHLTGNETFRFQKRESIRDAFRLAFNSDAKIQNAVESQCIDAVSLSRNLFIHKAGVVDQMFKDQCSEKGLTAWAALPIDSKLEFDGGVVLRLLQETIACGYSLLNGVDAWIVTNTPKP